MWVGRYLRIILEQSGRAIVLQPALISALLLSLLLALLWHPSLPSARLDLRLPFQITARIAGPPLLERSPDQIVFEVEPLHVLQNDTPADIEGRIAVYLSSAAPEPRKWFEPPLRFGEIVRFRSRLKEPTCYRVPGVADQRWARWARGVFFSASLKSPLQLERLGEDRSLRISLARPLIGYLADFRTSCRSLLSRPVGALLSAALTGDRRSVPPDEWDRLERLSLVHLLVVSGFHVGIVAWIFWLPVARWRRGGRLIRLAAVWTFALATGAAAPVTRAALVLSILEIGVLLGLRGRRYNILGAAALILLIDSPRILYSQSFQFTFLSVAAILAAAPVLHIIQSASRGACDVGSGRTLVGRNTKQRCRRFVRYHLEAWFRFVPPRLSRISLMLSIRTAAYLAAAGTVTGAIQLALLPLLLYYTNQWTLWAVPNNVLALPLFTLFLLAGFPLLLSHSTPAARLFAPIVDLFGRSFLSLLGVLDSVNRTVYLPPPGPTLLFASFLLLATALLPGRLRLWAVPSCPILLAAVLGFQGPQPSSLLAITLLDVGQAESIHLAYPNGSNALIDTAGSHFERGSRFLGRRVLARYLLTQRIRRLDFVLITHPEADHVGAFPTLSRVVPPRVVYRFAPLPFKATPQLILKAGDRFELGGVLHLIHSPPENSSPRAPLNSTSIVVEVRFRDFAMLLTGDIDGPAEQRMIRRLSPLDVLKVAHHGSRFGTSRLFLAAVRPRVAVISAGKENMFGHPSPEVLARLARRGCPAYATSAWGTLRIETDGRRWRLFHYDLERDDFVLLTVGDCGRNRTAGGADMSLQVDQTELR